MLVRLENTTFLIFELLKGSISGKSQWIFFWTTKGSTKQSPLIGICHLNAVQLEVFGEENPQEIDVWSLLFSHMCHGLKSKTPLILGDGHPTFTRQSFIMGI